MHLKEDGIKFEFVKLLNKNDGSMFNNISNIFNVQVHKVVIRLHYRLNSIAEILDITSIEYTGNITYLNKKMPVLIKVDSSRENKIANFIFVRNTKNPLVFKGCNTNSAYCPINHYKNSDNENHHKEPAFAAVPIILPTEGAPLVEPLVDSPNIPKNLATSAGVIRAIKIKSKFIENTTNSVSTNSVNLIDPIISESMTVDQSNFPNISQTASTQMDGIEDHSVNTSSNYIMNTLNNNTIKIISWNVHAKDDDVIISKYVFEKPNLSEPLSIRNIYAPVESKNKAKFIKKLKMLVKYTHNHMVLGDFNLTEDGPRDRVPSKTNDGRYENSFSNMKR
ncbi:hypothetical protein BB559_003042 [Furculomyces boomerangus]|uniref:Endonuclease/exonuclease/phosphatase domain-containing protein n=1 Tax=Furculomyces boomerangus TaxID=61424 RepID=A0A2T9YPN2_9FUNG|nr:hypothetical protein BB559_003042 [Furculomyces boomerangus]